MISIHLHHADIWFSDMLSPPAVDSVLAIESVTFSLANRYIIIDADN